MTENLLPGIELANGDCAAVLPELPPYDGMRKYGGYNDAFAFDFDTIAAACVANLALGGVPVWTVADQTLTAANAERVSGRRWAVWGWG